MLLNAIYKTKTSSRTQETVNPIPPGLFEGGAAWGGGEGGGKCPRPITLKLLKIMKWNLME